jgi:ribosome maturation factor RimP
MSKADEILDLLSPVVAALGLELLGLEYAPSKSRALLRLYIDAPDRPVNLDDCEAVSREVSATMDVNDPISTQYTLEVSSPGIDRPLFSVAQFTRFIGEEVKINLRLPQDARRRLQGKIAAVNGDVIEIHEGDSIFKVAFNNVEKARLVPDLAALGLAPSKGDGEEHKGRQKRPKKPKSN